MPTSRSLFESGGLTTKRRFIDFHKGKKAVAKVVVKQASGRWTRRDYLSLNPPCGWPGKLKIGPGGQLWKGEGLEVWEVVPGRIFVVCLCRTPEDPEEIFRVQKLEAFGNQDSNHNIAGPCSECSV